MIGFIIGAMLGAALGFTACALLSVEKVKPRLPDNISDTEELKQKALEYLRQMNPPPICKAELQAVNLEALLTFPFGAEEFGRILLKKDDINMETTYKATARVLKPKEDPDQ